MKRVSALGFLIAFVIFSMPAKAGWQNLEWGMVETEVLKKQPTAAPLETKDKKSWSSETNEAQYALTYSTPEFQFLAVLNFARKTNRLSSVTLRLKRGEDPWHLRNALNARYGTPMKDTDFKISTEVLFYVTAWRSDSENITWTFWPKEGDTRVEYSGRGSVNADGL